MAPEEVEREMDAFVEDLRQQGREQALAVIREEIGAYRAMADVAPTRVASLYAIHCCEVLESIAEKIRTL